MISEKFWDEKFIRSPGGKALRASHGFCEAATYVDEDVFPLVLKIATGEGEFLPCPQLWLDLKNGMLPAAPQMLPSCPTLGRSDSNAVEL